ncbi:MAG: substrate-binding domain-containing protein [Opitutaceae bacterium]|nr:substrate-binding domain-containing protein [Opitutaceae bacterium]
MKFQSLLSPSNRTCWIKPGLILLAGLILAASPAPAQSEKADKASRKLREINQGATYERSRKQFYTKKWDLSGLPEYTPQAQVVGTIRIARDCYLTAARVMPLWAEGFRKYQPLVNFEYVDERLQTGRIDIVQNRRWTFDEFQDYQNRYHHYPLELEMATGSFNVPGWSPAFTILVNKENPITQLTLKQLDGMFGGPRTGGWDGTFWRTDLARGPEGNIRTWGQVGLTGKWKDAPVNVYGRALKMHIQLYFERKVFQGGSIWNENLREFAHQLNPDGTRTRMSPLMVSAVGKDPYGIVYNDAGNQTIEGVKAVALAKDEGGPYVEVSLESVHDRTYPLFLEVYLYTHRNPDAKIREFLRYALSREGQEAIQQDGKWLPLTADVAQEQLKKLSQSSVPANP